MSTLHVVHVVRQFAPAIGGLEEAVLKLGLALRERGVRSTVITLDRVAQNPRVTLPAQDSIAGLPVRRIPFSGSWRYPLAPAVLRHLGRADVVHVHAIDFFFDFLAATRLWHRKPLIASTHGGFFHTPFARRAKQLYFHTATRLSARAYHTICASSRSDLTLFEAIAPENVALVENGVDTAKWAGRSAHEPQRHLLAIGRFASHKQIPKLFAVLRALQALDSSWRLTVAGSPGDVPIEVLRAKAAATAVGEAVEIIDGPSDDELARLIATGNYIVSASRHEGFGLAVVEGMAAGLVPLLNDIPPFRDLVARSGCGRVIAVDDPAGAATIIEQSHQIGLIRPGEARAAAIRATGQFSWIAAAARFETHYRAAANRIEAAVQPREASS